VAATRSSGESPDRKEEIRRIAAELFARHGYHATGIVELGEAVGLGKGALYHHIGTKEQLLSDIINAGAIRAVEHAEALLSTQMSAEEKVRELSRSMMEGMVDDLPTWTVFYRESHMLSGKLSREATVWRDRYEEVWTAIIRQGVEAGEFREIDPLAIKGILGMHNYAPVWVSPNGPRTADEISEIFCDLFLAGLRVS
jgi:AcrR family transcriptional regulator